MTRRPPPGIEQHWTQALDDDPLVALHALHALRRRLREWEHQLVVECRTAGRTWQELAEAVGTIAANRR